MVNNNVSSCIGCIHGWGNFVNLTTEQLERVNENRYEALFQKGEIIFKEGSPASDAVFLASGLAKIFVNGHDGKKMILSVAQTRQLILGPGFYVDNRHHYSLGALTDVKACFINANILRDLVHENSAFAEGFLIDISTKSLRSHHRMVSLMHKKMHGRLAEGLLYLADQIFKSDKFPCLLSRQEMGEYTGMTKESVVRLLKEFDDEGIVRLQPHSIELLNKEKLKMIMQNG